MFALAKSHHHAIHCLKVETSQMEVGSVTETSLGLLLPVSLFWFLSAERAGVTDRPGGLFSPGVCIRSVGDE